MTMNGKDLEEGILTFKPDITNKSYRVTADQLRVVKGEITENIRDVKHP
jgi:hypothetical protein